MSALEEYEEAKFSIPLPPDQRVREAVMSILVKADAAIAALEAENERLRDDKIDLINQIDNDERAERLKCCGNCGHWWPGLLGCEMDPEEDGAVCEGFDACHVFNQSDEGPREPCWQPYSRERR